MKRVAWLVFALAGLTALGCGDQNSFVPGAGGPQLPPGEDETSSEETTDTDTSAEDDPGKTGSGTSTASATNSVSVPPTGLVTGTLTSVPIGTSVGTTTRTAVSTGTEPGVSYTDVYTATGTITAIGTGTGVFIAPPPIFYPGQPPVDAPDPVGCVTSTESVSESSCQIDLTCTNDYISTYCYWDGARSWWCDCSSFYGYQSFELSGADSSSACTTASELCRARVVPEFTEPEVCSVEYQYGDASYCDMQERCTRSSEVAEGVDAVLTTYNTASCYSDGTGALSCQCNNESTYRNYQISGVSGIPACELTLDLCDRDAELVFDEPATCGVTSTFGDSTYCDLQQTCTQTTEVSDGVAALQYDYQSAWCQALADGTSSCSCQTSARYLTFEMQASTVDSSACQSALVACTSEDELAFSGDVTCERAYQSAYGNACDTQLKCTQPATLGRQSLLVVGSLNANCQLAASGSAWSCWCSSGANSATLEVEGSDAWDVCAAASERCPSLVDVQFDSGSYYGPWY